MATQPFTGALTTLQNITNDFADWVVAADCTIVVASGNAIADSAVVIDKALQIKGELSAALGSGVNLQGDNYDITVASGGSVTAKYGLVLSGSGSTVINNGDISGELDGIFESGGSNRIVNNASLESGFYGIEMLGTGSSLTNGEDGVIDGEGLSVWFGNSTGKTTFLNEGLVKGAYQSIGGADGRTVITNTGTIEAAVYLGGGNDTFINKGGVCKGTVDLEAGSDLYVIDKTSIKVSEFDAGNKGDVDTVKASASFTLGAYIDNLVLTGKGNLKGTGNELDNVLTGNSGNNILDGKGGDDVFTFVKACGSDTINGFADKQDLIDLSGYRGIDDFADIKNDISSAKGDVIIDLGGGDKITIDHVGLSKVTAADFQF